VIGLIERNLLAECQMVIKTISPIDARVGQELCDLWWQRWSRDPSLELAFPDMIESLPKGPLAKSCIAQLKSLLIERFGTDLNKVGVHLKAYFSGHHWSAAYSTSEGRVVVTSSSVGEFIPWLLWHAMHEPAAAKKLVGLLDLGRAARGQLYDLIAESRQVYIDETSDRDAW
jgi:hypothetical protein